MATLAACSGDNTDEQTPQADGSIRFEAEAPLFTRSLIDTDAKLRELSDGFGVFAYYTEDNLWDDASSPIPNFMYNQRVTYAATSWQYSPVKYWPNDDTKKYVSFFAYAPYSSAYSAATAVNASNEPLISYTRTNNVNPSSQSDLLYASQTDCYKTMPAGYGTVTGRVPFHFRHALAAIEFKVRRKDDTGEVIYLSTTPTKTPSQDTQILTLTPTAAINTRGTFNLGTAEWDSTSLNTSTPTISYLEDSSSSPERHDINSSLLSTGTGVTATTDATAHALTSYTPNLLLLMPQESETTFSFTLHYTIGGTEKAPSGTITFADGLAMGTKYTVVFVIDGGEVESYLLRAKEAEQW